MLSQWETEFSEFSGTMPAIPDSWLDVSYGNDTCPSFIVMQGGVGDSNYLTCKVWIDCANPEERENPESKRFSVTYERDSEYSNYVFMSDSWAEILDYVAVRQFLGAAYAATIGYNPFLDCPEIAPSEVLSNIAWHRFSNGIEG
jgi:hypothetical protein